MAEDPLTTHARARVGRLLRGKWTLDRLIGVGGMAAVYEATHRNGSKVAIKMLHPTLMYDTNFASRLVQEGYVANKINHPAAVKVFDDDTDETDGTVFLVMELLEGQTISQARRKKKRFPPLEALKMLIPVLECLGNAHERGIIHRDIKPENLFITRDGVVHVLDFGIARVSDGNSNVAATRAGMVVGSPAYMSPEQALGKMNSVGPQTDVYAVGATMFALIAGATPHAGESTQEMIVMVATQAARPIASVMPDVPPSVAHIVDKALSYDKDKRFANARVMLEEVRATIAELEGTPRVLPTFADEDDEGETTVNAALQANGDGKAAPLPAAGLNRVGTRPQTGRFNVPAAAPSPIADPFGPPVPPAPPQAQKSNDPGRLRPATMAPTGAPAPGSLGAFQPGPPPAPPSLQSGPHLAPGISSGQHPMPGIGSGQHQAPPGPSPMQNASPQSSDDNGLPPTMAIPVFNTADLMNSAGPGNNTGPGVTSGPRPGATTNMAWATPPAVTPDEAPPVRKPRTALFAAAAVGVLALGGIGFAAFGGSSPTPTPTPIARPATPPVARTEPAPTLPAQPEAPAQPEQPAAQPTVIEPATPDAAVAEPAAVDAAVAAPPETPTQPETPAVVEAPVAVRHRTRDAGAAVQHTTTTARPHPHSTSHGHDPLGY